MLAVLLSMLQLFIYSELIPSSIGGERAAHFCEFINVSDVQCVSSACACLRVSMRTQTSHTPRRKASTARSRSGTPCCCSRTRRESWQLTRSASSRSSSDVRNRTCSVNRQCPLTHSHTASVETNRVARGNALVCTTCMQVGARQLRNTIAIVNDKTYASQSRLLRTRRSHTNFCRCPRQRCRAHAHARSCY
jgi:hypothetical protein